MQRFVFFFVWLIIFVASVLAQKIEISGNQESDIFYRMEQRIEPNPGIELLVLSLVVPQNFRSPTYQQEISNLNFDLTPAADAVEEETDSRGNIIRRYIWRNPGQTITARISFRARNKVFVAPITINENNFPVTGLPAGVQVFLQPTDLVQSDHPDIQRKARELVDGAQSVYEAIQRILLWTVEHMHYVLIPPQFDALYAFRTGEGNCQNYSHLAAALLRAVGIPTRIVNGITLKEGYEVETDQGTFSFRMAQGRHSWIEVYLPDVGWIPFDAQQSEFFVSNRYLRIEVGLDNEETIQDGLVRWRQSSGSKRQPPKFEEVIEARFVADNTRFRGERLIPDIRKIFLGPVFQKPALPPIASVTQPMPPERPEPPVQEKDITQLTYDRPFVWGNLNFPEGVNFALVARDVRTQDGNFQLQRNFLVETAEYVTSREQFAQAFVLDQPVFLEKIGLALYNFGGSGQLWVELAEDVNGHPGPPAVSSARRDVRQIVTRNGYRWVDFDFRKEGIILSPGKYWIRLAFSGGPIVNWFYSYSKVVGPPDGTRSRPLNSPEWNKILPFEFNFRIVGKTPSQH
ncbi:MAG: transglutaminase domain-containing protein [Calditrichaeota bacterium]|nr:transglutaminase domain-containing protein [Calditrichota bacterium]